MKVLFNSIILSLLTLFLYWTGIYFLSGYNLSDNTAHLNLSSMLTRFNTDLKTFGFAFDNNGLNLVDSFFSKFDNILENFIDLASNGFNLLSPKNTAFKILLTGIVYIVKFVNFLLQPLNFIFGVVNSISSVLSTTISFVVAFVKMLVYPVFI